MSTKRRNVRRTIGHLFNTFDAWLASRPSRHTIDPRDLPDQLRRDIGLDRIRHQM